MAYEVHLNRFEGPLDLLLHLIEQAKVDIKDIFISEITAQYLALMDEVEELDMDTASEFLTMAATLVYIKSRSLLPRPPREEAQDEEDPEEALVRQLREYKAFKEAGAKLEILQQENANLPDIADRASSETDRAIELRARDRQRKLISKIDAALQRIDDGTYGFCEETGDPISLKRLDARPIATLSIEAQERHERREKVYRDD